MVDIEMLTLDDDELSTAASNLDSITEDIGHVAEILPCDEMAFRRAQELLKINDSNCTVLRITQFCIFIIFCL